MSIITNPVFPFKRLALGDVFSHGKDTFRKVKTHGAFRLLPSGRGQVHRAILFSNSAKCVLVRPVSVN